MNNHNISKIGCLLIHGFTGNSNEVCNMSQFLESKGIFCITPNLVGHGTENINDIKGTTYNDWIKSAEEYYIYLSQNCDVPIVGGFSMGGLIAAQIAGKYNSAAYISMNSPIYCLNIRNAILNSINDLKLNIRKHLDYYMSATRVPLSALYELRKLIADTKPKLTKINCPSIICQSLQDEAVKSISGNYIYERINSKIKKLMFYYNSNHLIYDSEDIEPLCSDVFSFLEPIISKYSMVKNIV